MSRRSKQIDKYMKFNELTTLSIIDVDGDTPDPQFSMRGCDICDGGGDNVYECHGYSQKHKKIFDGFDVCGHCICIIYNGED